jgi:hypothetical protein
VGARQDDGWRQINQTTIIKVTRGNRVQGTATVSARF